jgi:hypothetical protein
MANLLDKAVTGIRGAETPGKNQRYRYKFEFARDAYANQILTKYGGFVRLLQRYILHIELSVPDRKSYLATEFSGRPSVQTHGRPIRNQNLYLTPNSIVRGLPGNSSGTDTVSNARTDAIYCLLNTLRTEALISQPSQL